MPNTTFTDNSAPAISADWLNGVGFVLYNLLGNGINLPATRAEILANIGGTGTGGGTSGGVRTFQQEIAPPSPVIGDLWQVPSTGIMSRWSGAAWIVFGDIAGPIALAAQTAAANALAAATAAQTAANIAVTEIANISSDNVLSSGEKSAIILDYSRITVEQAGIDNQATAFAITTEKTSYDAAIAALTTYLGTLTAPTLWNNTSGDTTIVGATFRANFGLVYSTRQTLLNQIATVSKAVADSALVNASSANAAAAAAAAAASTAQTAANVANAALAAISSDNILSVGEKPAVILDWNTINGEHAGIDAQAAALGITTLAAAYDAAYTALSTYLVGINYTDLTANSVIVGATFRTNFTNLYTARQALLNEVARLAQLTANNASAAAAAAQATANSATTAAANAQASATAALNDLANIASDNVLSKGEKPTVVLDWTKISNEQLGIDARADAYGIARVSYDNSISALGTYLTSVAYSDFTTDTAIVGTTFRANFSAVYTARQALLNEIARIAGTVAIWAGVSGVAVTTGQIIPGAVSITTAADNAAVSLNTMTAQTTAVSPLKTVVTFTSTGANVTIIGIGQCNVQQSGVATIDNMTIELDLYVDGVFQTQSIVFSKATPQGASHLPGSQVAIPVIWLVTPAAGSHLYQLRMVASFFDSAGAPVSASGFYSVSGRMVVKENKV